MAPTLRLFISPGTCSLATHILLQESGLPFTTDVIYVREGFPKEFEHLNPKKRVPFLVLGDEIITENPAIMTAITQQAPEKHFLGKSPLEIVRSYEWLNWLSGTLHGQGYGGLYRPVRYVSDEKLYDAVRGKGRDNIRECYESIEAKLEGRNHAVGNDFTAVDAYLLVFYRWGNGSNFGMEEKYPNYTRLVQEVSKRDAVKATIKAEGIDMFND